MKWTKFDQNNFPNGEVLAINSQHDLLIGYLTNRGHCESDVEVITGVTHYIHTIDLIELKIQND